MEPTNQTPPEKDEAFDAIKAKIPMEPADGEDKPPVKPAEAPVPPKEPVTPPKEDKTVEDKKDEDDEDDVPSKKPNRPEKYIPVKQYTSEKKQWGETKADYEKRIADLQAIVDSKPDSKKEEDIVKKYAEKHDVDEETAKREIARIRTVLELDGRGEPTVPKKPDAPATPNLTPEQQAKIDKADEVEAQQAFDTEFKETAIPQLKKLFPTATPDQLEKAKVEMEALATTKPYLDKTLDYIAFKETEAFEKIFAGDRKGPESSKPHQRGKESYKSSDFAKGKTPFSALNDLPLEEKDAIIKGFDVKTWDDFTHWSDQQQGDY